MISLLANNSSFVTYLHLSAGSELVDRFKKAERHLELTRLCFNLRIFVDIVTDALATKSEQNVNGTLANFTRAQNSDSFAAHVKTCQMSHQQSTRNYRRSHVHINRDFTYQLSYSSWSCVLWRDCKPCESFGSKSTSMSRRTRPRRRASKQGHVSRTFEAL